MQHPRFRAIAITLMFVGLIAFPFLDASLHIWPDIALSENRTPKQAPVFSETRLDTFPQLYEAYYTDNFPGRYRLVNYYGHIQLSLFNTSPRDKVLAGKDGWYFMHDNEHNAYLGRYPLDADELGQYQRELDRRTDFAEKHGAKFYFMVAPSKSNIYSEKLPDTEVRLMDKSWGEILLAHLNAHSHTRTIDLYAPLRKDHEVEMNYYMLDNHWNDRGAFKVANAILNRLHEDFPAVTPLPLSDYNVIGTTRKDGALTHIMGMEGGFIDSTFALEPKSPRAHLVDKVPFPEQKVDYPAMEFEIEHETGDSTLPKLLIITDSFGLTVYPFLRERFSRSVKIWDHWQYKLNEEIIEMEKPDIVLCLVLEGNLRNMKAHFAENK